MVKQEIMVKNQLKTNENNKYFKVFYIICLKFSPFEGLKIFF